VAERWDNPSGPSSNYDLGVDPSEASADIQRTVVFVRGETQPGQDMFIRGGIDHAQAEKLGIKCVSADNSPNYKCALPIAHRNHKNAGTAAWKPGDKFLDWYGHESTQVGTSAAGLIAQGSAADWTTNAWPAEFGLKKTVESDGYGLEPLNTFGMHYWMLDVNMDCSRALQDANGKRWFEVKSYISNGPGWEGDVKQAETPYPSANHFAQCGKLSVFERGSNSAQFIDLK
jgi:alpha-amylase